MIEVHAAHVGDMWSASVAPGELRLSPPWGAADSGESMAVGEHAAEVGGGAAPPPQPWPSSTASLALTLRRRYCRVGRERVASL